MPTKPGLTLPRSSALDGDAAGSLRGVLANAGLNLGGQLLPLAAAAFALPFLATRLGAERFGLLTLGWVLVGYFSLFDFGVGRAMTKLVAERVSLGRRDELAALCSTGAVFAFAAGVAGALAIALASTLGGAWLARDSLALQQEAANGLLVIALGIAPTVGTAALRGVLEGFQEFRLLTAIRAPAGVASFLAPCVAAAFTPRLEWALLMLVLTRWLVLCAHVWGCRRAVTLAWSAARRSWIRPMLSLGGWMTVSNVVGPAIVYADRVVIGGLVSAVALGYYAAPFELVSRLLIVPVALSGALFPALAAAGGASADRERYLRRSALFIIAAWAWPLAAAGTWFAQPLLAAWMGTEYAAHGARVMQILLIGFAFNAMAQIPFAALHGRGLARQTAVLHLFELPVYLGVLVLLATAHGIDGAAAAWALRGAFDFVALVWLLSRDERR